MRRILDMSKFKNQVSKRCNHFNILFPILFDQKQQIDALEITAFLGAVQAGLDDIFLTFPEIFLAGGSALVPVIHVDHIAEIWQSKRGDHRDAREPYDYFEETE